MILFEVHLASTAVSAAVDASELSRQVGDAIRLRKRDATYNQVYFNPLYLEDLFRNVRGLEQAGFRHTIEEGETTDGHKVAAKLVAPDGSKLDLGAVLLDGTDFRVIRQLAPFQRVVNFVANHGPTQDETQEEPEQSEEEQPAQEDLRQEPRQEPQQEQEHDTQSRRQSEDPNAPEPRPPFSGYAPR